MINMISMIEMEEEINMIDTRIEVERINMDLVEDKEVTQDKKLKEKEVTVNKKMLPNSQMIKAQSNMKDIIL